MIMDQEKVARLEKELQKYKEKLSQMQKDWSATRAGSCYGDEYLEVQIKVYQSMMTEIEREIVKLKNN
jgi:DNA-binding protein YbaB